ncbi:translation initiation factor IF-3 [Candidatus Uhrbacteria bacterium]|nr:translation initiation factor IF-3 [Candidatus Uhrbacteria bacterium]
MRIHYRRRVPQKPTGIQYRVNEQIMSPEVRVIDDEGKFLGVLPIARALTIAREREYDLVEVSPKETPPVCRLLDYGAFKYQKDKEYRTQKAHAKKVEVKGIRLSVKMGAHDLDVRLQQALAFLEEGQKLKIEIIMRGREKAHAELAVKRIQDFIHDIGSKYTLYTEQEVKRQGGNVSAIIGRKS